MKLHKAKRFNGRTTVCGVKVGDDWDKAMALNLWGYAKMLRDWFGGTICRKCWRKEAKP